MKGMIILGTTMLLVLSSCRQYETCATYAKNTKTGKADNQEITVAKL